MNPRSWLSVSEPGTHHAVRHLSSLHFRGIIGLVDKMLRCSYLSCSPTIVPQFHPVCLQA